MNNFKNWLRYFIFFLSMIGGDLAYAFTIPKEDRVECLLPNGDKFVLIAKYKWDPLARLLPHATSRYETNGFDVWYQEKGKRKMVSMDQRIPYTYAENQEIRETLCSNAGFYRGTINSPGESYKLPGGGEFIEIKSPYDRELFSKMEAEQAEFKKQLEELQAYSYFWHSAFGMAEGSLFYEGQLQRRLCRNSESCYPVVAVWQSFSKDMGKTWSDPILTKDSKLFVIGKTLYEQPGVAKPGEFKLGPR